MHVHGTLFVVLSVLIGYLLITIPLKQRVRRLVSVLGLLGILMPVGILAEVLFAASPFFALLGTVSMTSSMGLHGIGLWKWTE